MIRRAEKNDADRILVLLDQVQNVHALGRPDYFNLGARKYTEEELLEIIADDNRPIYVYLDEEGILQGYAFCVFQITEGSLSQKDRKTLYIDDLCVDENYRRHHVGQQLFDYVEKVAAEEKCDSLTLNVWECNPSARAFYDKQGMQVLKTTLEKIL